MVRGSINGKKIISPGSWSEVTTEVFQKIITEWGPDKPVEKRDYVQLLNILTDSDFDLAIETPRNKEKIWQIIKFVYETEPYFVLKAPDPIIEIANKTIEIPIDISRLSIGQSIHLRAALEKHSDLRGAASIAAAIYLQPVFDEARFDYDSVLKLEKVLLQMPAEQIFPIGFFFLRRERCFGSKPLRDLALIQNNLMLLKYKLSLSYLKWKGLMLLLIWSLSTYIRKDSGWIPTKSTGRQVTQL